MLRQSEFEQFGLGNKIFALANEGILLKTIEQSNDRINLYAVGSFFVEARYVNHLLVAIEVLTEHDLPKYLS